MDPDGMKDGIDASDFQRAAAALHGAGFDVAAGRIAEKTLRQSANAVRRGVRAQMRRHRKTGRMARFVAVDVRGRGIAAEVKVRAGGIAAPIIVKGQRAHDIGPVRSHALAIKAPRGAGGAVGFAAHVRHPGAAGDPMFAQGVEATASDVRGEIEKGTVALRDALAALITKGKA